MLNINLICVGKLKEKYLKEAVLEYQKRLSAYAKLNIIELPEAYLPQNPSQSEIFRCIETEGKAILQKAKGFIVSLCIEGQIISSEELAKKVLDISNIDSEISFIIGGSFGIFQEVKDKSKLKLSMSKMTFPHQLARVMLLEQIYRAFQINTNGKYHK
ncbi:MAG: 23S rRNA (pseudouridine(1915)-N(3))-methyltransferase RlmH [Oscillospiraceae bacterium]